MNRRDSLFVGAMRAAEESAAGFHAMAYNLASAVFTLGRQCVNRTFEAIEVVGDTVHDDLERFVVFIAADFAFVHK
jgi:hypothetical protein